MRLQNKNAVFLVLWRGVDGAREKPEVSLKPSCYDTAVLSEIHAVIGVGRLRVSNTIPIDLVLQYCDKSLAYSGFQSSVEKRKLKKITGPITGDNPIKQTHTNT